MAAVGCSLNKLRETARVVAMSFMEMSLASNIINFEVYEIGIPFILLQENYNRFTSQSMNTMVLPADNEG